jgi:type I restriction enzyme, R subunit
MNGTPQQRVSLLPAASRHILAQDYGKERLLRSVAELSQVFVLEVPHEEALGICDVVDFFHAVLAVLARFISRAVVSDGVIHVFKAVGLKKPDFSILSDEFLAEVKGMPQRNLAVELFQKLLKG